MTVVKFKNRPTSFNNVMDDFFTPFTSLLSSNQPTTPTLASSVPVNIKETENGYELQVIAPGYTKEDMVIDLNDKLLTVSAEKKSENEEKAEKYVRSEYKIQSFKRSFTVDETIDANNISAQYVNGVLTLNLPKKEEVKPATKQITVQ